MRTRSFSVIALMGAAVSCSGRGVNVGAVTRTSGSSSSVGGSSTWERSSTGASEVGAAVAPSSASSASAAQAAWDPKRRPAKATPMKIAARSGEHGGATSRCTSDPSLTEGTSQTMCPWKGALIRADRTTNGRSHPRERDRMHMNVTLKKGSAPCRMQCVTRSNRAGARTTSKEDGCAPATPRGRVATPRERGRGAAADRMVTPRGRKVRRARAVSSHSRAGSRPAFRCHDRMPPPRNGGAPVGRSCTPEGPGAGAPGPALPHPAPPVRPSGPAWPLAARGWCIRRETEGRGAVATA